MAGLFPSSRETYGPDCWDTQLGSDCFCNLALSCDKLDQEYRWNCRCLFRSTHEVAKKFTGTDCSKLCYWLTTSISRSATMKYYFKLFALKTTRGLIGKILPHTHLRMYNKNWQLSRWKWVKRLVLTRSNVSLMCCSTSHSMLNSLCSSFFFCHYRTSDEQGTLAWKLTTSDISTIQFVKALCQQPKFTPKHIMKKNYCQTHTHLTEYSSGQNWLPTNMVSEHKLTIRTKLQNLSN